VKIKLQGKWQEVKEVSRTRKTITVSNPVPGRQLMIGEGRFIGPSDLPLTFSQRSNGKWILKGMSPKRGLELVILEDTPSPGKNLVDEMKYRVDMQSRLLREVWTGFVPFNRARNRWKTDLRSVLTVPVEIHQEPVLATMVKQPAAEFARVVSAKVIMDTAEMEATPYKVFDAIELQRKHCVDEVVKNVTEREIPALYISPLNVAAKGECYIMEFYFYAMMIIHH